MHPSGIQPISFLAPYGFTHPGPDCFVPHPTGMNHRPPSASPSTISSTL
ncbi:unnamed protein product [Brassica napus]|uniref:(rape) hypothetical protein n=1 Tax=Brassica napus TaxID=3708 RepID=A0A816SCT4_BRANA|nr:unnamed protein product [Brassica napus]